MMSMVERWVDLPVGARVALVLAGGGGVATAAFLLIGDPRVFVFVGLGLALVAALFAGYRWVLKKRKASRSAPFEKKIAGSGAATPREVSDPSRRAQIDSMRKKFEEGLRVYRQRGKDLYSVPWFVVIGEPSSGKSAAIRNSGVGFPPGLHEEMRGVGGTLNMDWFFTNDAVILDTAGRLAFEEVETSKTTEWQEFLRLLRAARPRCPINGMLVFIPVDSLKTDTADVLEQKAGKIAQQLDLVQQTLGVRFPMSVVISKADLLVGFSEFFEGIADPREQYQMFGWSNPKPLDEPFRPAEIGDALRQIRERVVRRRMLLLKEPAPQTLVAERRLDEVDRLFLLPDEIRTIEPRLKRYLELCFAGGQWSSPPPFLRGVYFTSALREGEAVDLALAQAIGVEAADLQERRAWDKKRSFFLHDVFVEKVFRERGLVTAAPSPGRAKRKRRAVLFGAISTILVLAIGLSLYSAYQFYRDLKGPEAAWSRAREAVVAEDGGPGDIRVVETDPGGERQYLGDVAVGGTSWSRAGLTEELGRLRRESDLRPTGLFAVFNALRLVPNLEAPQLEAQRAVFDASIATPLLRESLDRLGAESVESWSEGATEAYVAVLGAWAGERGFRAPAPVSGAGGAQAAGEAAAGPAPVVPIGALGRYVLAGLSPEQQAKFDGDLDAMRAGMADVYGEGGREAWPPKRVGLADGGVSKATDTFVAAWDIERASPKAAALIAVARQAAAFDRAEGELLGRAWFDTLDTEQSYTAERDKWERDLAALDTLGGELDQAIRRAGALGIDLEGGLDAASREAVGEARANVDRVFGRALGSLPAPSAEGDTSGGSGGGGGAGVTPESVARRLAEKQRTLREGLGEQLREGTASLASAMTGSLALADGKRRYAYRLEAYRSAGGALASMAGGESPGVAGLAGVAKSIGGIEGREREYRAGYGAASAPGVGDDKELGKRVQGVCSAVVGAGAAYWRYETAGELLDLLESGDGPAGLVQASAGDSPGRRFEGVAVGAGAGEVALSNAWEVDRRFEAGAAGRLFEGWAWLHGLTASAETGVVGREGLALRLGAREGALRAYAGEYIGYWGQGVRDRVGVRDTLTWSDFDRALPSLEVRSTNRQLAEIADARLKALQAVPAGVLGDVGAGVSEEIRRARSAFESFGSGDLERRVGDVRKRWSDLPAEASGARVVLLGLEPATLKDDYLVHTTEDGRASSLGFWDSLTDRMLKSIATDAAGSLGAAWSRLGPAIGGAPFCKGGGDTGPVDYAGIGSAIDELLAGGGGGGEGSGGFRAGTLGAGGASGIAGVDRVLEELRRADKGLDAAQRTRLERVRRIAAWLQGKPTVQMSTIDDSLYPKDETCGKKLGVSLGSGGTKQSATYPQPLGGVMPVELGAGLEFRFWSTSAGGTDMGGATVDEPWGLLGLLWHDKVAKREGKDSAVWVVPLPGGSADGTVWIGLSFSEDLPVSPSEWPSCGEGD